LCVRQKLWGKARTYCEAALALQPGRAAHLTLAHLLDSLGEAEAAQTHFRRAAEIEVD
jgi:HemY protein